MKEKNKKVLKGLGVGALACVGMVGLTGCSINLNQEQIDKLMYTVDKSDMFMSDILELMENQNTQFDKEQAFNRYKLAENKITLNYDNIWKNLKVTSSVVGDDDSQVLELYINSNDEKFAICKDSDSLNIIYANDIHNTYFYEKHIFDEIFTKRSEEINFETQLAQSNFVGSSVAFINEIEKNHNDIYNYEVKDNGDEVITMVKLVKVQSESSEDYDINTYIIETTINNKGFISEIKLTFACTDSTKKENVSSSITGIVKFEYGVLTDNDMEGYLNIINSIK